MKYFDITTEDRLLVKAAVDVLTRNYREERHTVGAAVLCASGKIFAGVNVESCGYGPCAEPIAIGAAVSQGEREFKTVVAVAGWNAGYPVIPPCGNCRQLIRDYSPKAKVLLEKDGGLIKVGIDDLLPMPFKTFLMNHARRCERRQCIPFTGIIRPYNIKKRPSASLSYSLQMAMCKRSC